jgi:hypothetical protein
MIAIKSTQKLASSKKEGLCDVRRQFHKLIFDTKGNLVLPIQDVYFQEQVNNGVTERKIVEVHKYQDFKYPKANINAWFTANGVDITTSDEFFAKLEENSLAIFIDQTVAVNWEGMNVWVIDDFVEDENNVIVSEFSA